MARDTSSRTPHDIQFCSPYNLYVEAGQVLDRLPQRVLVGLFRPCEMVADEVRVHRPIRSARLRVEPSRALQTPA